MFQETGMLTHAAAKHITLHAVKCAQRAHMRSSSSYIRADYISSGDPQKVTRWLECRPNVPA